MRHISQTLAQIMNLRAAADEHKRACDNPACNVSLMLLRQTCSVIRQFADAHEQAEIDKLTADWPF